ncbi:MAG: hypothetical protein V9E94_19275 [Microthrixaceae bacterium]
MNSMTVFAFEYVCVRYSTGVAHGDHSTGGNPRSSRVRFLSRTHFGARPAGRVTRRTGFDFAFNAWTRATTATPAATQSVTQNCGYVDGYPVRIGAGFVNPRRNPRPQ